MTPTPVDREVERGTLEYDADEGHSCSEHGRTMHVAREVEPTASGSVYWVCSVCGGGGWSGL